MVKVGKKVDLVPITGTMSALCLATRSATGNIVEATECDSPADVTPSRAKAGEGCVVIEIDSIYSPSLKLPDYKYKSEAATLLQFKKSRVVVRIRMLRIFVEDANVQRTPVDEPVPAVPVPKPINESPVGWSPCTDGQTKILGEDLTYTENAIDKFELSPSDI